MSIPTLSKTWQFNVNNVIASQSTLLIQGQNLMFAIVGALIGFGSSAWTVVGSSDSSTAALDTTNRWMASTNLVWATAGSVHSWIVLKQAGIASNFQLCIDLNVASGSSQNATFVASPNAGFTGGSTTARPTATDEAVFRSAAAWSIGTIQQVTYHAMMSTDGQCTRVLGCTNSRVFNMLIFDKAATPVTNWAVPTVLSAACLVAVGSDGLTYANYRNSNTSVSGCQSGAMALYMTAEEYSNAVTSVGEQGVVNELSNEWPISPIGLVSADTGKHGRHGTVFDLWWGSTALRTGAGYPNDDSRQLIQFGQMIFPWNGSVPMVA